MTAAIPRLLRDPRAAQLWFTAEASGVVIFWVTLLLVPAVRPAFTPAGAGEHVLWGFAAADSTIVLASCAAATGAVRRAEWAWVAMLAATASWSYPTIYWLSIAVGGYGAEAATVLMLPVAVVNLAFTVAARNEGRRVPGRLARHASDAWNVIKTCGELLILWAVFLWLLPTLIDRLEGAAGWSAAEPEISRLVGFAVAAAGAALLVWSALYMAWKGGGTPFPFDAPRRLVVGGPYRFVRNPQVVGGLLQGVSLLLFEWSPLLVAYLVVGVALWQLVLKPWEESDLSARFGGPYEEYRAAVRCWLPRLRPYHDRAA